MTLYCKKLESIVSEARQLLSNVVDQDKIDQCISRIETFTKKVEEVQQEYAMALDRLASSSSTQDMCDYEQYMAISEATLLTAHEIAADLRGVLRRVERAASSHSSTPQYASSESGQTGAMPEMTRATLPPIPIPSFAGDIWEWDNFWALFNANVHSQPIPNLLKFNHLLNALKGEPRRAV
ncbi:unnamed protein product, partial [Nippostrongylus brasiliensis]|uniref:FCH domain-containing protein n=1 Tax=Nippostrongylus brasiliensis TaxID=27835 RepID=A0A0N4YFD5_NIPBR